MEHDPAVLEEWKLTYSGRFKLSGFKWGLALSYGGVTRYSHM